MRIKKDGAMYKRTVGTVILESRTSRLIGFSGGRILFQVLSVGIFFFEFISVSHMYIA